MSVENLHLSVLPIRSLSRSSKLLAIRICTVESVDSLYMIRILQTLWLGGVMSLQCHRRPKQGVECSLPARSAKRYHTCSSPPVARSLKMLYVCATQQEYQRTLDLGKKLQILKIIKDRLERKTELNVVDCRHIWMSGSVWLSKIRLHSNVRPKILYSVHDGGSVVF